MNLVVKAGGLILRIRLAFFVEELFVVLPTFFFGLLASFLVSLLQLLAPSAFFCIAVGFAGEEAAESVGSEVGGGGGSSGGDEGNKEHINTTFLV